MAPRLFTVALTSPSAAFAASVSWAVHLAPINKVYVSNPTRPQKTRSILGSLHIRGCSTGLVMA